ncbi:MAG: MaoC family dehydratase [Proteobacteria bacterium]|nr:MaoC family dehydratase [Pseudomonadota bacterium]
MPENLTIEAYTGLVGQVIGHSGWITVDQKMIDGFCDVTGDYQFIHNDPERAKDDTPFGGTIAHGFLTLSLITQMYKDHVARLEGHEMIINYGLEGVRFLTPVPCGAHIRGQFTLKNLTKRREGQYLAENQVQVAIKGHDKPAMIGTWLTLLVAGDL